MTPRSFGRACLFLIVLALALAPGPRPAALALDLGVATGTLTVDGTAIALTHAYAWRFDDEDKLGDGPELRILLSDRDVPKTLLAGHVLARLDRLVHDGGLRGLLFRLDPQAAEQDQLQGVLLIPPPQAEASLLAFSSTKSQVFPKLNLSETRVVGETKTDFGAASAQEGVPTIAWEASFSAPLFHDEAVSARYSGAEANVSPPAQALISYLNAVRSDELAAAAAFARPERIAEMQAMREQLGEQAFRQAAVENVPDEATIRQQIIGVVVRGPHAVVLIQAGRSRGAEMLTQTEGRWLVD